MENTSGKFGSGIQAAIEILTLFRIYPCYFAFHPSNAVVAILVFRDPRGRA